MKAQGIILLSLILVSPLGAQQVAGAGDLRNADSLFNAGDYVTALATYQKVLLDPQSRDLSSKAAFGLIKTYFSLQDYKNTELNIEYFLLNFPKDPQIAEVEYQKGRLLYNQGEFQKCLSALDSFLTKYPDSALVSNALFWMGDSAFNLGKFDQAKLLFTRIVNGYPNSFKLEAARYRLAIIDLKSREEELLKLLKWSHEEGVNALDEFQRREKAYQQSLLAYQKKILDMQGTESGAQIANLERQIKDKDAQIKSLKAAGGQGTLSDSEAGTMKLNLLTLKANALALKELYLDWTEKNGK